jgi:hypothetical protein
MNPYKTGLYFIVLALLVIFMIALNESGYGVFALFLLFPACWLMVKAFGMTNPPNEFWSYCYA